MSENDKHAAQDGDSDFADRIQAASARHAAMRRAAAPTGTSEAAARSVEAMFAMPPSITPEERAELVALRAEYEHQTAAEFALALLRRAMVEGRTTPPTLAEVQAHVVNRGGWWLIVEEYDFGTYLIERESDIALYVGRAVRWIACDSCGCPCGWPLAPFNTVVREKTT